MCHTVKGMLEDKQPNLTIHISASTREAGGTTVVVPQDLMFTVAPTSHLQAILAHLEIPMEKRTQTISMS